MVTTSFYLETPWKQADFSDLDTFVEKKDVAIKVLVVSPDGQGTPARWYAATSEHDLQQHVGMTETQKFVFQMLVRSHKGWKSLESHKTMTWDAITCYKNWNAPFDVIAWIVSSEHDSNYYRALYTASLHCTALRPWAYPILFKYPSRAKSDVKTAADRREYVARLLLAEFPHLEGRFTIHQSNHGFFYVVDADVPDLEIESQCDPALEIMACNYMNYLQYRYWFEKYRKKAKDTVVAIEKKVNGKLHVLPYRFSSWYNTDPWSYTLDGADETLPSSPMPSMTIGYLERDRESENRLNHPLSNDVGEFGMVHLDLDNNDKKYGWGNLDVYRDPGIARYLMFSKVCTDPHEEMLIFWTRMEAYKPIFANRPKTFVEDIIASVPDITPLGYIDEMRAFSAFHALANHSNITLNTSLQRATFVHMARIEQGFEPTLEEILYVPTNIGNDDYDMLVSPYIFNTIAIRRKNILNTKENAMRGGLLIAPCGWGKTVVTLALLSRSAAAQKTLIVCPSSLVAQWKSACETMTRLHAVVVETHTKEAVVMDADVVIITYNQLRSIFPFTHPRHYHVLFAEVPHHWKTCDPIESSKPRLAQRRWDRVIFDESHVITEKQAIYSQNIQAPIRWGLTATPVPDTALCMAPQMGALWAHHISGTNTGSMSNCSTRTFLERCCIIVRDDPTQEREWSVQETIIDIASPPEVRRRFLNLEAELREHGLTRERSKLASLLLRKVCVGIPGVKVPKTVCSGSKRSITKVYDDETEEHHCSICLEEFVDPVATIPCGHVFCTGCIEASFQHKKTCPQCRAVCNNYLSLCEARETVQRNARMLEEEEAGSSHVFDPYRVRKAIDLIGRMASDDKILVFSQYETPLAAMGTELETHSIGYEQFCTKSSVNQRREVLNNFMSNPDVKVLLLNLRLANAGLNLMAANKIIFLESCVSVDIRTQAIGRANRNGQTRDVQVFTLIDPETLF